MPTIEELQIDIQASSNKASAGIDALTATLLKLKNTVKGGVGLTTTTKQLKDLSQAVQTLQAPTQKIQEIVSALKPLESIGKSGLGTAINQLKKIPEVTAALAKTDMGAFAAQIQLVVHAIRPLSAEMEKVYLGFSKLPANIQKAINANARLTNSNRTTGKSFSLVSGPLAKLSALYISMSRVTNVLGDWITESNAYVENLNLFTVAMGEYADQAKEYAETVGNTLGIDPSAWMRNQGIFMTLATGFGVVSDKAYIMSKNLTQLGYDLSSFFNISVEDAMQKLQSGIAGELEPLRRLGYDLSQARLEQIALNLGIEKSVNDMNQAEKSQLRYYAILTQVTTAQGDMARTLESPANQLRILAAAGTQAARALGNIFIPALNTILPYAIAFLQVVRNTANSIANLFGFSLPEIDYSGLSKLGDITEDTTQKVQKLKNALLGIDELNILRADDIMGGKDFEFELPQYDFIADMVENNANKIAEKLKEPFEEVLKIVGLIAAGILAWKISTAFMASITAIQTFFTSMTGGAVLTTLASIAGHLLVIAGLAAVVYGAFKSITEGVSWESLLLMVGGVAAMVGGLALALGVTAAAIGLLLGGIALLVVGFMDIKKNGLNLKNELLIIAGLFATGLGISLLLGSPLPMLLVGLGAIVLGIIDVVQNGTTLQNSLMITGGIIATVLVVAIKLAIAGMVNLGVAVGVVGIAIGVLVGAFLYISSVWDQMTGWEKVATIFTGIAAAVLAAALAITVFHASWTMGIGVAAIVGGIAAALVAFAAVKNDVNSIAGGSGIPSTGSSFQIPSSYSTGTYTQPTGSFSTQGTPGMSGESSFTADSQEVIRLLQEIAAKDSNTYLDGQKVSQSLYPYMQQQGSVYGASQIR